MDKTKTILIAAFTGVAVVIGITTLVLVNQPAASTTNNDQQAAQQAQQATSQVSDVVTFTAVADQTVLAQLKANNDTVVTKDSAYGEYVDSINGKVGGTDGYYWSFYVDGQMASIGAGDYKTTGGEKVEWKFEKQ